MMASQATRKHVAQIFDFLTTLRAQAQNDINIRTKQGQHVGNLTFTSLQMAREVRATCDVLLKVPRDAEEDRP